MSETASERRRDYTVSRPVQLIYMATWIGSIALLAGFAGLAWSARELSESALAEVTLLGMSGLLVKSVAVMEENIRTLNELSIKVPVILGGAALTRFHAEKRLRDIYEGRLYYGTQVASRPPSFTLFVNDPKLFGDTYRRYVERQIREGLGFEGTPLKLFWRGKQQRDAERDLARQQNRQG